MDNSEIKQIGVFIDKLSGKESVEQLCKYKGNIERMLLSVVKMINENVDIDDNIKDMDVTQLWAIVNGIANKEIMNLKQEGKDMKEIENELDGVINKANKDVFGIGKKRGRDLTQEEEEEGEGEDEDVEDDDEEDVEMDDEDDIENEELEDEEEKEIENEDDEEEGAEMDDDEEIENEEEEDDKEEDKEDDNNKNKKQKKQKDHFFSMEDLNKFADEQEEQQNQPRAAPHILQLTTRRSKLNSSEPNNKSSGNFSEDDESLASEAAEIEAEVDSNEEIKYDEFFDAPQTSKPSNTLNKEDEDIENDIFTQIADIESKMLGKKEWHLKGEVLSSERPKESLLSNPLDFEVSIKPPPVPDKTFTTNLEQMIKQRIKDDLFDDPIRKAKININKPNDNNDNEINLTRDRKGLSELYENDYTGQTNSNQKEDEIKKECDMLCDSLYHDLDLLTNSNFTPYNIKQSAQTMTITNIPAIQIEDVGNYVSDNKSGVKSAKEMIDVKLINEKSKEENTKEDKQRIHNRKKRNIRARIHRKENLKKLNELTQQTGSKFEAKLKIKEEQRKRKEKAEKENAKKNNETGMTNTFKSTQVFSKINEIVKDKQNKKGNNNNNIFDNTNKDFKKYKL